MDFEGALSDWGLERSDKPKTKSKNLVKNLFEIRVYFFLNHLENKTTIFTFQTEKAAQIWIVS